MKRKKYNAKNKNIEFKINLIKNLMRFNYGLSGNELDLHALVDPKLSSSENWYIVKPKVLHLCTKANKLLFTM